MREDTVVRPADTPLCHHQWQWRGEHQLSCIALELVFKWLGGEELVRAGAVSRAWRRVAAGPALWRRLLVALAPLSRTDQLAMRRLRGVAAVEWRQLYVEAVAGWEKVTQLQPTSAGLLHAALCPSGERLALLANDATVSIWERRPGGEWTERWSMCLWERGWASAERGEWAAGGARLLVVGTRALLHHDSRELLVLHADKAGCSQWRCRARARASVGAAGCWVDAGGDAFLSFELRSLAPALAATTVWLNATTQEAHSEYAGVTTPLLRIFNEGGHLLRALVAEVPEEGLDVGAEYLRATGTGEGPVQIRLLVAMWRRAGGGALGAWALAERHPPPLMAADAGDLRSRYLRWRVTRAAPAQPERDPTEAEVRALCTPPDAVCPLPARPAGLVLQANGRCAWVCWSGGGGACLSLPTLRPLRALAAPGGPSPALDHYTQPAVSGTHFAAPAGDMSGAVNVWSVPVRGRHVDGAPVAVRHRGAALAALLAPARVGPRALLVLTADAVHVWRSRATPQPSFEA